MTTIGRLRLRRAKDGAVEVWARGWRLEARAFVIVPLALAVAFAIAPVPLVLRVLGLGVLAVCTWLTVRLGRIGIRLSEAGVEVVEVRHTVLIPWEDVAGFVGERTGHDGRAVLMTESGKRVPAPGTFDAEEMDPFGDEGEESIVDELNRLVWAVRRGDRVPV
jgi:Bacterial PH domain